MTSKVEGSENRLDALKWLAVALLVAVGVVGNQYFSAEPILYRVLVLLVLAAAAGFLAFQTAKGKAFAVLLKEARVEIRKVVWPTRQETTRMTWVVIAVVIIISLVLAGFDFIVKWAIELFLNLGR